MADHGFGVPTTRAEALAYIDHEFTKGETLNPRDLYEPTNVSDPRLNTSGQSGIPICSSLQFVQENLQSSPLLSFHYLLSICSQKYNRAD
jgi:hypothetical protein